MQGVFSDYPGRFYLFLGIFVLTTKYRRTIIIRINSVPSLVQSNTPQQADEAFDPRGSRQMPASSHLARCSRKYKKGGYENENTEENF